MPLFLNPTTWSVFITSHSRTPCSHPSNNTSTSIPFVNPRVPLGNTMMQFPRAIEDTAFDLLNPAGTATDPFDVMSQTARTKRVNGFGFVKSSPSSAFMHGIYGVFRPHHPKNSRAREQFKSRETGGWISRKTEQQLFSKNRNCRHTTRTHRYFVE